ncbi:MAG TPA: FtsQ-type POTRA domain-containing protein [Devosiaceae bacterium]|nr:FtsQ-type POTRA domain-containing protein [Devosiaceae bacterium]
MQQVGADAFASAIAVDPKRLPGLIAAPRRRSFLNIGRVWVLHRKRVLQGMVLLGCCAVGGGLYQVREEIGTQAGNLYVLGERQLAHSPFAIARISISGMSLTDEKTIVSALAIRPETSMFNFDADAARQAIEALPAVSEATVRKVYPSHVYVSVTERVPVARWRLNGVTYLIDSTGAKISENGGDYPSLPLVVGDAAGDDAMVMLMAMNQYPALKQGLVALSRIADRRWDMIYQSGLRIQLPESGVAQALAQLMTLQDKFQLLQRDIVVVDLRVPGIVAVEPSQAAAQQLAAAAKARLDNLKNSEKKNPGADADYAAPAGD